ncbi:MAG: GMC family oxidoreductase, partial [Pseudomonadota bacterium]
YDGRPGSIQDGFNFQGDKHTSKWSTAVREIPRALETGLCDLRPESHAVKITHDASGKVDAVLYIDKDGNLHRQAAKAVCVAGNSIETARLLLLSDSNRFPTGLANGSDQVGRNYMRHLTGSMYAWFEKPVNFYRGETMAGIIKDEVGNDPSRGFVGGYYMETLALGPAFLAAFVDPGMWGPDFTNIMDHYENMAGMWIVGEDMPQATNRITLSDTATDQWGLPAPNVHFDDHPNDVAMREYAYEKAEALYKSVGAIGTHRTPPYPSTHNLGTCRMSERPEDGVVNRWGQAHEVPNLFISDGSVMTTGAAANPTLTIVALAIRQAEALSGMLSRGEI